jgi:hypothetical protein
MESSNVKQLVCSKCWSQYEKALYRDRWRADGLICRWCWAWQHGDLPEARMVEAAQRVTDG